MSLVGNVMPDNSYKKYLKMFCGLILVVLVINPFYEFLNYDGSIKDIFKGARFDSEVAHIKGMLISNEENAKAQAIREYENILKEELQYIANNEGLYILDVKVKISENEEIELTGIDLYVTKDSEFNPLQGIKGYDTCGNEVTDKIIDYFHNVDLQEQDEQGKYLVKVKDVQAAMKEAADQIETLKQIESLVKKEVMEQSQIRGGAVEGFMPDD